MSVFEVDVVQTTGTWEFLIDQGVWELEVVTGPRGPIYVAGDPISHTVLTDRSSADQHPMSAITGLVAALAAAGGVPDAMFLIGTNEVDGTAATMATLDWDQNATASGLAPDHYTATATFAPADLAAYLTGVVGLASDYVVNVVVPGGPHPGAYSFTPATIADPWTALGGFVATKASSDWLGASVGDGDSWLKINEKNAASIDYIGTGLLLSVVNVHSALHAVEGILDRWSFNCGMSLTANVNIAATNPTLEYGGCVAGGRVFLNAQTTPSQNGHYYVNGDLTITRLNHPDVFDPPGNGYRATLVAPADPAHGLTLMWVGDDRTHYFRGGSQTQVGAPGDPGEWIVVFDPTATGGTVTTSSITGVATARILGRTTAGTGTAEELTASQVRTLLGLVIGTDVQAHDAELAAIAGLTSAADSLPYFTGSGTAALATLTTFIRTLLDDADAATARTTLGLGALATASTIASADITDGTIVAGDLATALSNRIPTVATAGSDTSVTSSTTLTNDTGLVFAIPTTGTWHYRATLWVTGDSAGDLDTAVTTPANTVYFAMTRGISNAASSQPNTPNDVTVTSSGTRMTGFGTLTAGATMVTIEGTVVATATGNIQVQHSQRNSNATATIVKAGSSLSVWGG